MKLIMSSRIPIILILLFISACARHIDGTWKAPLVYRIDIQQGNVIDQEMINKLQPGMDKKQVKFIMGTPMISDPFHNDRWDYVYSMEPGKGERQQRRITLYFKDEKLAYVDGDIKVNAFPTREIDNEKDRVVDVPLEENKEGFFSRMFNKEKPVVNQDEETSEQGSETALAEEPDKQIETDTDGIDETSETTETTEITTGPYQPSPPDDVSKTATADVGATEPEQEKNLIKRFWKRITSGADDSTIQEGKESERDRRDAEVLESAGGQL